MNTHPEIECLKNYFSAHQISISKNTTPAPVGFVFVDFQIDGNSRLILVDDEYGYFSEKNALMNLYLTLSSLEAYGDSDDYLSWAKQNGLNASDLEWMDYYKSLDRIYKEIQTILGAINPCISSFDFQLRTAVFLALINAKY